MSLRMSPAVSDTVRTKTDDYTGIFPCPRGTHL